MKYVCPCGYEYDPAVGDPDNGVAPARPGRRSRGLGLPRLRSGQELLRAGIKHRKKYPPIRRVFLIRPPA